MQETYLTASAAETETVGANFAKNLPHGSFVALYGDLGVGKTAFVRGMASVLAPNACVQSPTYAIVHEYPTANGAFCHMDMYRIASEDDLESIGFYDYMDCTLAVEWCEHIPYALPDTYYMVDIRKTGDTPDARQITIARKETAC